MKLRRRPERGAAAVEFALVMPILLTLVFGIIQYGWYFYVAEGASGAASNVTRRLAVGDCWGGTEALTLAQSQAFGVTGLDTVPTTLAGAEIGVTQVSVTVTADADIIGGLLPLPDDGVVTRTVVARLEDVAAGDCS